MKITNVTLLLSLLIFVSTSCTQDEASEPQNEIGFLRLDLGLNVSVNKGRANTVSTDDFEVTIYDAEDNIVVSFDRFAEIPGEIPLESGEYYLVASSGEVANPAFEAPYYEGTSDNFVIEKEEVTTVSVTAELGNVKVSLNYSDDVQADFSDWETTITTTSGSLSFEKDETRSGYFAAGEDLQVEVTLTLTKFDNSTEERHLSATITDTQPKDHYEISIDYNLASGRASIISITIDETTNDKPFEITGGFSSFSVIKGGSGLDRGEVFLETDDGNYVILGTADSNDGDITGNHGSSDAWLIKLNDSGELIWEKSYGGSLADYGYALDLTSDGGYILAGGSSSSDGDVSENKGSLDAWAVKLSSEGVIEWESSFGGSLGESFTSILQTADGGYIASGYTSSSDGDVSQNNGNNDYWVVKMDATGGLVWEATYGGSEYETAHEITTGEDGGFVLVGETSSSDGDVTGFKGYYDVWVVKIDATGAIQWQKTYGGTGQESGYAIVSTMDGGYAITGRTYSTDGDVVGQHGNQDFWVVKLDNVGTLEWQNTLGGSFGDSAYDIQQTFEGDLLVAGYTQSTDGDISESFGAWDMWLVKLDQSGSMVWEKSYGDTSHDQGRSVQVTPEGAILLGGFISDVSTTSDNYWMLKLDGKGNF